MWFCGYVRFCGVAVLLFGANCGFVVLCGIEFLLFGIGYCGCGPKRRAANLAMWLGLRCGCSCGLLSCRGLLDGIKGVAQLFHHMRAQTVA